MTIELTEPQQKALDSVGASLHVIDPRNKAEYVLVRAEAFERMKAMLYDDFEFNPDHLLPLVNEIMAEDDAKDPLLESYQHYQRESK